MADQHERSVEAAGCVLVIDDDENVRALLERQIRRLGYEVLQATDGLAGLSLAVSHRPQVILVDLRMPGIDGHTFLRRLTAAGSAASVVAMSGQGNMDDVIDVLRAGVIDYLRKPWSVAELAGAVERGFERQPARNPVNQVVAAPPLRPAAPVAPAPAEPLSEVLTRVRSGQLPIPAMPTLVVSLRAAVQRPSADLDEVVTLIEQDQRLTGDVLRLSNTAHYARGGRIHSIRMAVARIGFRQLQNLVETIFLREFFQARDPEVHQLLADIWKRSVAHATAMREVASAASLRQGRLNGDTAYLIGLMADVGASLLLWLADERKAAGMSWSGSAAYLPTIRAAHQDIGAALLGQWMVEPTVIAAVSDHHGQGVRPSEYARLMVVASELAEGTAGIPADVTSNGAPPPGLVDACLAELRLDRARLPQLAQEVRQRCQETIETLG